MKWFKYLLMFVMFLFSFSIVSAVTDTAGYTLGSSVSQSGATQGIKITTNKDINVTSITKHSSDTSSYVNVYTSSGTLIRTSNFIGNSAPFTDLILNASSTYQLLTSHTGTMTRRYTSTVSYPYNLVNINIVGGLSSINGDNPTQAFSIMSVTSVEYFPLPPPNPIINFQNITLNNVTNFNNTFYNSTALLEVTLNTSDTNNNVNVTLLLYNSTNDLIFLTENFVSPTVSSYRIQGSNTNALHYCLDENYETYDTYTNETISSQVMALWGGTIWATSGTPTTNAIGNITCKNTGNKQFITNGLTGSLNISLPYDDTFKFSLYAVNNEISNITSNYTIIWDTYAPNVSVKNFTEWNLGYNVTNLNTTLNITCEDPNIDFCELHWEDNTTTDISITQYKLFTTNGNHTFELHAHDLAGNIEILDGIIFINPINYFYFEDASSNPISNFTFNGTFYTDFANITHYSLGLGNHSMEFQKVGFFTQTFNITFNSTNELNQTFSLTSASINIQIRDKRTLDIITVTNFTIELIGSLGVETSTITGYKNLTNIFFESGEYRLLVSSSDYFAEDVFFNFSNEEVIDVVFYMNGVNESNAGIIIVSVVDGLGQALPGAIVQALQWDGSTSQFIRVSEGQTGLDGTISLNVILEDKIYIFRATDLGNTADSPEYRFLITENGKIITIPLGSTIGERTYLFRNLLTTITELSFINNISTIEFEWVDQNGMSQEVCINSYRYLGTSETLIGSNCTTGVSGTFIQAYLINTSHNINIKGEIKIGDGFYTMKTFNYPSDTSFPSIISFLGFGFVIIPLLFLLGIAVAIMMENIAIGGFLLFLASGFSLYLVPTLINGGIVMFLYAFSMLIIWGAQKAR